MPLVLETKRHSDATKHVRTLFDTVVRLNKLAKLGSENLERAEEAARGAAAHCDATVAAGAEVDQAREQSNDAGMASAEFSRCTAAQATVGCSQVVAECLKTADQLAGEATMAMGSMWKELSAVDNQEVREALAKLQEVLHVPLHTFKTGRVENCSKGGTAPAHQPLGSANAETTPARAPAAVADRKQRPDATCEGKNG